MKNGIVWTFSIVRFASTVARRSQNAIPPLPRRYVRLLERTRNRITKSIWKLSCVNLRLSQFILRTISARAVEIAYFAYRYSYSLRRRQIADTTGVASFARSAVFSSFVNFQLIGSKPLVRIAIDTKRGEEGLGRLSSASTHGNRCTFAYQYEGKRVP